MCGLAAIFAYRAQAAPVDGTELLAIREAMRTRGPDGADSWLARDGRVGLAHRRLAIIDLSLDGAQPMALADGSLRIVFNGEIYNHVALRRDLEAAGAVFRSGSDTEVILHLYRRHGREGLSRLRGMYALALWDERRRGMLLARDPYGIKPLYYADDGATIRVASQVKALLAGGAVSTVADPAGHVGFFLLGYVPDPHTLHRGIRALPAGTSLWINGDGNRESRVIEDVSSILAAPPPPGDLREALLDSVRHHLVADVPVGVFLSSGLDSATLAGLASEVATAPLDTLTLAFDEFRGTERDESSLAEIIAATYGTRHTTERLHGSAFQAEREALLAAMDQPSIDGVNVYFVARAAAARGLKVALSGLGGDELFGGYDSFVQVPRLVRSLGWVPGGRALGTAFRVVAAPLLRHLATRASPKYAGLLEWGTTPGDAYLLRRGLFMPWELPRVLDPDLVREGWRELRPRLRLAATCEAIAAPRRKVAALESLWYMRNQLLRDADWAGMAHSLEIRVPLVDVELLRRVTGLDADKQAMARTPAIALPRAVLERPKTGFFVPVRDWLQGARTGGERGLRGWAREVHRHAVTS